MFRMWAKIVSGNRLLADAVVCDASREGRTRKVFAALDQACREFDLARPIWLDTNIEEFRRRSRTRFGRDSFLESISFDYLEIQVIEEDG